MNADEVTAYARISYRQLDFWCRSGYLHPHGGGGSGRPREFTPAEADVARTMGRLVNGARLTVTAAHRVARGHTKLAPGVVVLLDAVTHNDRPAKRARVLNRLRTHRAMARKVQRPRTWGRS